MDSARTFLFPCPSTLDPGRLPLPAGCPVAPHSVSPAPAGQIRPVSGPAVPCYLQPGSVAVLRDWRCSLSRLVCVDHRQSWHLVNVSGRVSGILVPAFGVISTVLLRLPRRSICEDADAFPPPTLSVQLDPLYRSLYSHKQFHHCGAGLRPRSYQITNNRHVKTEPRHGTQRWPPRQGGTGCHNSP